MKKFIKASFIILAPIISLVVFAMFGANDKYDLDSYEEHESRINMKYKGYEEDNYSNNIIITLNNNSKDIASLSEVTLSFEYKGEFEGINPSPIIIRGYERRYFEDNKSVMGINPGESEDIIFKIPKGVKFDERLFDTKEFIVDYNASFYKMRITDNSLILGLGSEGRSELFNFGEK